MHQPDRTAAVADRLQQPRDEIAMHGGRVAAGTVLQHAEAIDDDIDACSRISRASAAASIDMTGSSRSSALLFCERRNLPRDPDHMKSPRAQIVGDEAADQAGGAEHQNFSDVGFMLA